MRALALMAPWLIAGCYLAHEREASCAPPESIGACSAWEAAGPSVVIARSTTPGISFRVASAAPSACGVVVAWTSTDGRRGPPYAIAIASQLVGWDGSPIGAAHDHPALDVTASSFGTFELARNGATLAALAVTESGGTHFASLEADGADRGAGVALDGAWSFALAPAGDGFSFLRTSATGATPATLVSVDANGGNAHTMDLVMAGGRALWSRATFDDGSFLAYAFREDPMTAIYSGWLQHFDREGAVIAPEVEVGVNGVPILVAPITQGALTLWETATPGGLPMQYRTIDRDGNATSATTDLAAEGAQYGATLVSTADGGALATWLEDHFHEDPEWRLRALAFGPDGAPRGAITQLSTDFYASPGRVVLDDSGTRGLIVFDAADESPHALPIRCAR